MPKNVINVGRIDDYYECIKKSDAVFVPLKNNSRVSNVILESIALDKLVLTTDSHLYHYLTNEGFKIFLIDELNENISSKDKNNTEEFNSIIKKKFKNYFLIRFLRNTIKYHKCFNHIVNIKFIFN